MKTDDYAAFLQSLSEINRMDFAEQAFHIAAAQELDAADADQWERLGWQIADRAQTLADQNAAVAAVGLAATLFDWAETLRGRRAVN